MWLRAAALLVAIPAICAGQADLCKAQSANYPQRTVRLVVPFTAGASTDLVARLFGQKLSEAWGHPVIVENRGGAGGSIGAEAVAKSEPDGYTLMVTNQGPTILNVLLRKSSPYTVDDFSPVVEFGYSPLIVVVNSRFPADSMRDLVAYATAHPGKVLFGSSGTNSNLHVALEMFRHITHTDITHIPYKGTGPTLSDVIAGNISGMFTTTVSAEGLIKSGQVKVLGVAGPRRLDALPNVPTFAEQGIRGADAFLWVGLVAPGKTPAPVIDKINHDVNAAISLADVRDRFSHWGLEPAGGRPRAFEAVIRDEIEHVKALVNAGALQVQ